MALLNSSDLVFGGLLIVVAVAAGVEVVVTVALIIPKFALLHKETPSWAG